MANGLLTCDQHVWKKSVLIHRVDSVKVVDSCLSSFLFKKCSKQHYLGFIFKT